MKAIALTTTLALCALGAISVNAATTVYRSVDAQGVVSFSDQPPAAGQPAEQLVIDTPTPQLSAADEQRLTAMRETTDRMAADRRERELHRAQLRELAAQGYPYSETPYADSSYTEQQSYYRYGSVGYRGGAPLRRWHKHHRPRPENPIARPPLRHDLQHRNRQRPRLATANSYPASVVRQGYSPRVRAAFKR